MITGLALRDLQPTSPAQRRRRCPDTSGSAGPPRCPVPSGTVTRITGTSPRASACTPINCSTPLSGCAGKAKPAGSQPRVGDERQRAVEGDLLALSDDEHRARLAGAASADAARAAIGEPSHSSRPADTIGAARRGTLAGHASMPASADHNPAASFQRALEEGHVARDAQHAGGNGRTRLEQPTEVEAVVRALTEELRGQPRGGTRLAARVQRCGRRRRSPRAPPASPPATHSSISRAESASALTRRSSGWAGLPGGGREDCDRRRRAAGRWRPM